MAGNTEILLGPAGIHEKTRYGLNSLCSIPTVHEIFFDRIQMSSYTVFVSWWLWVLMHFNKHITKSVIYDQKSTVENYILFFMLQIKHIKYIAKYVIYYHKIYDTFVVVLMK